MHSAAPAPPESGGGKTAATTARRNLSRRVARAVPVTALGTILTTVLGALSNIIVARSGGPTVYAPFLTANILLFVAATLCDPGITWSFAKSIAGQDAQGRHHHIRRLCGSMLTLGLGLATALGLALFFIVPYLEHRTGVVLGPVFRTAMPFLLIMAMLVTYADGIYYGLLWPRVRAVVLIAGPLAMLVYLTLRHLGQPWPLLGAVGCYYVAGSLTALFMLLRHGLIGRPLPPEQLRPVLRDALPGASLTALTVLFTWSDRWVVGTQLGAVPLSLYSTALNLIQVSLRLPASIANLLLPASSRAEQHEAGSSNRYVELTLMAFGALSWCTMALVLLLAPQLIELLYGPGFLPGATALRLMSPSIAAAALSTPLLLVVFGGQHNRTITPLLGIILPVRLVLLYTLTGYWNLEGTAVATALSDCLLAAGCVWLARRSGTPLSWRLGWPWMTAFAAALGIGALLLWWRLPAPVAGMAVVACFAPLLWRALLPLWRARQE